MSTACSRVDIDGQEAVGFAQVVQIRFAMVGRFCIGSDMNEANSRPGSSSRLGGAAT